MPLQVRSKEKTALHLIITLRRIQRLAAETLNTKGMMKVRKKLRMIGPTVIKKTT